MPDVQLWKLKTPFVSISIPGKDTSLMMLRRISWSYNYNTKKRDDASIVFMDDDRQLTDGDLLYINSVWSIRWGWEGYLLSPIVHMVLKDWSTEYNEQMGVLSCNLVTTKGPAVMDAEVGLKREGKMWGKMDSSEIALAIAKKYKLKYEITESNDKEDIDYFQPITMGDYAYLNFLASEIGFDFKIDSGKLYYKERTKDALIKHKLVYLPSNGEDTVVLSFGPEVKIISKNTKTVGGGSKAVPKKVVSAKGSEQARFKSFAALNDTLVENTTLLSLADKFVSQELEKVNQAETFFNQIRQDTGLSPATAAAAKALIDRKAGLAYALQERTTFTSYATESLIDTQAELYSIQAKYLNGDAKDCKPRGAKTTGTELPAKEIQYSVELGLNDERSEKLVTEIEAVIPVATNDEAKRNKIACAKNKEKVEKSVKASLSLLGLPFIRERDNLLLVGFGPKFSGIWHISECKHTITESYTLECDLKRGLLNPKKSKTKKKTNDPSSTMPVKEPTYVVELGVDDYRYEKIRTET